MNKSFYKSSILWNDISNFFWSCYFYFSTNSSLCL